MADYYSQCVVSPQLPLRDITASEQLVLRNIFDSALLGEELYLFAEIGRHTSIALELPDMLEALSATAFESAATMLLTKGIDDIPAGAAIAEIEIDDEWIDILQEILRRSSALAFITIETSFNCSKMRSDGFGGGAVVITADAVDTMSTRQFIDETRALRLGGDVPVTN